MTMVTGDKVRINLDKLQIADIDDFRDLTGQELDQFVQQMDEGLLTNISDWGSLMTQEMRALLWVLLRDDETRNTVWDDPDEMYQAMQGDIRRMKLSDFERFETVRSQQTRQVRQRATAADGIDAATQSLLAQHGYVSAADIEGATDKELLKIKGIGRVKLHHIRMAQKAGTL